uniref:Uncharacterized protein n=1 Tax=Oryza brachyantha TaxID=4533 RepID=J3KV87_ORYBR
MAKIETERDRMQLCTRRYPIDPVIQGEKITSGSPEFGFCCWCLDKDGKRKKNWNKPYMALHSIISSVPYELRFLDDM